nr:aspartate carbamoyltransferase [Ferrimicrobium sp.]
MEFLGSHLLSVDQLSREDVELVITVAQRLEPVARRRKITRALEGAVLASLFLEASTRTRLSFGSAFSRLGGAVRETVGLTFSSMAKGESIADTARVISGYADIMTIRHPEAGSVAQFADASLVPVINAGDGAAEHPTQALLDIYTIEEEFATRNKRLDGSHILFVGDLKYGRTVHSLIKLLSLYERMTFTLLAPELLSMPASIVELVEARGHRVNQLNALPTEPERADVIYTTRIQRERLQGEQIEGYSSDFHVNMAFVNHVGDQSTVIMHPLPRDSTPASNDLSTDLDTDPRLAIFRQTDRGIPIRMALFALILGVADNIEATYRDPSWRVSRETAAPPH